jgi:hypothetical protein
LRQQRRYGCDTTFFLEGTLSFDRHRPPQVATLAEQSFWRLLFRYLWPFLYFRDVSRGQKLERQQNYRYNRAMRVVLPGFALKWGVLTAVCFGLGGLPAPVVLTACFFVTGTWTLVVCLLIITAWCWLERFPELY